MSIIRFGSGTDGTVSSIPADPQHDDHSGEPSQLLSPVAVTQPTENRIVTAQRSGSGQLQMTAWSRDEGSGALTQTGQATGDTITGVSACALDTNRVVTCTRNSRGNLELITWDLDVRGGLTRRGTGRAGEVTAVAVCPLGTTRVVAAMRNGSANLELITWDVDTNGNLTRTGTGGAGTVWAVGITAVTDSRIVAVMKNGSLNLELIVFDVNSAGEFKRQGEGDAGTVNAVDIASLGTHRVVAAMRNGSQDLELIIWDIADNGHLTRRGSVSANVGDKFTGEKTNIGVTAAPLEGKVVSAARNRSGVLELTSWAVPADGRIIRESTETAESTSAVAVGGLNDHSIAKFATAIANMQGQLECIAWSAIP